MPGTHWLRWGIRLLIIHLFFILIVWLATYFSPLDLVAGGAYLYVLYQAGILMRAECPKATRIRRSTLGGALGAGLIAQAPGIVLAGVNLSTFCAASLPLFRDCRFIFQLWHTPIMPFLTFFAFPAWGGYNFYFWALNLGTPLYLLLLVAGQRKRATL